MDSVTKDDAPSSPLSLNSTGPESEFNNNSVSAKDLESTQEIITNFELDVACICEKLTNLNLLLMQIESKESDFEAFVSDMVMDSDLVVKTLKLDFLSGFLDSEVKVLETHVSCLQDHKANVREFLSSRKHLGEPLVAMEDMLSDSEKSLEQSMEQILEIKAQAANFERKLSRFSGDKDYTESSNENVNDNEDVLRLLDESLEREIVLEKRVSESSQIEEDLTKRLCLYEQEVLYAEEEAEIVLGKFYEADHASDLLMETSRELLSEIKLLHFNVKGALQREAELKTALITEQKASTEMENMIKDLKKQIIEAESRVVNAEARCQLLTETSNELKDTSEKVVLLEKELSDTKVKLQHAEACYEASEEDKIMSDSTIEDMGNVINDLKEKFSKAEIQIDSLEDKCIFLSETNEDLKKELSFSKSRVKCLEASLHKTEESKKATVKDINLRTKLITDLVMQMALERERLQKQISSLKQENKTLVSRLKKTEEDSSVKVNYGDNNVNSKDGGNLPENEESLSTNIKLEKTRNEDIIGSIDSASELQTERNIDIRELKRKYILLVIPILVIPLLGVLLYQTQVC